MNLESQVAPLELARRMKDLGFPQDCAFAWLGDDTHHWVGTDDDVFWDANGEARGPVCAAPTVAEIGEALMSVTTLHGMETCRHDGGFEIVYRIGGHSRHARCDASGATEAEARARLWIALAEAGQVKP